MADEPAEEPIPDPGTDDPQAAIYPKASVEPHDATPSVLAVVVAHDPSEWFEETLDSIATQDYPRLQVMVIDTVGDPDLARRVRATIPRATVLDASDTNGFGAAANTVLDTGAESAFFLICHDDVALDPDAVRVMVTESLQSNAGVVGPKLVEWDRPDRLQHVGLNVDRFGVAAEAIEPSELDQEQYDFVTDFSAVPSACILIRADLFSQLGGYDPAISFRGDDVDLCWRSHLAGSRVVVAPDARVRHIEDLISRTGTDDVRRTRARHQMRTVLTVTSWPSLLVTLPLQMLLSMVEAIAAVATGSFSHVRDVFGAYVWNLRRSGDIIRRRRALRHDRRRFSDLRQMQSHGSVRISAFIRGQIGRNRGGIGTASRGFAASMRPGTARAAWLVALGVIVYVLFGSRSLITDGVPAIGDFTAFPAHSGDMLSQWWNGWRDRDLGSPGALPSGVAILAVMSWLLGGSLGLVRTLWVIGPLFVGLVGAWRMTGWMGSRRAQVAALLSFVVVPLPWSALGAGSLAAIYAYSAAPWVIDGLLRASDRRLTASGTGLTGRISGPAAGAGVALGLTMMFEPTVLVMLAIVAGGLLLGGIVSGRSSDTGRLTLAISVVVVVTALLSLPLVLDVLVSAPTWAIVADGRSGSSSSVGLSQILRFSVGTGSASPLLWLMAVPMAVPILIGRSWRFERAVQAWVVCLVGWAAALLSVVGVLPFGLPDIGVLLAGPAMAVVLLMGLAVVSIEHDLRKARFGWRQLMAPVAVVAVALTFLPAIGLLRTGRWDLGTSDFQRSIRLAEPAADGSYRVLWIGAPENLPVAGRQMEGGMAWAATLDGMPTLVDRFIPADDGAAGEVGITIDRALDGSTARLGRDLGGLGIRYVVMIERLQPAPFSSEDDAIKIPPSVVEAFVSQLDLARIEGTNSSIRVFENTEWTSVRSALVPDFDANISTLADLETSPLSGATGVLAGTGVSITGPIPDGTEVLVSQTPDSGWHLDVESKSAVDRPALGWATAYSPESGGSGRLSYSTPMWRRLALVAQGAMLLGSLVIAARRVVTGGRV